MSIFAAQPQKRFISGMKSSMVIIGGCVGVSSGAGKMSKSSIHGGGQLFDTQEHTIPFFSQPLASSYCF